MDVIKEIVEYNRQIYELGNNLDKSGKDKSLHKKLEKELDELIDKKERLVREYALAAAELEYTKQEILEDMYNMDNCDCDDEESDCCDCEDEECIKF